MGISIVVGGSTVRFPDDSLGVLDPDTVESTLVDVFQLFGATQEEAEQKAADSAPTIVTILDGQQPDLVGPATENISRIMAALIAGLYLQQLATSQNFNIEDNTLGIIDPDTALETLVAQLITFGFPQEAAEEVGASAVQSFLAVLSEDPTNVKKAVINIAGALGVVGGGMTAQGQALGQLNQGVATNLSLIQTEIQSRIDADDVLRTEIETEEAAREEADGDLSTRIDGHDTALEAKADLVDGKIITSQLPALATFERRVVADQAARLALTDVQAGDVAVQLDSGSLFMLAGDPAVLADWLVLEATSEVSSVNGQTGTIILGASDVGADAAGSAASAQTFSIQRSNHTGTQAQSTIVGLVGDLATLSASVTAAIATAAADATTKANAAQAAAVQRANHTGTQSADTLTDGTTKKVLTDTERTKLAGIAEGATAGLPASYLDTDPALTANSDVKVPSQKALLTFFVKSAPRHRWTSGVSTPNTVHAQASGNPVDQRIYWGQPYDIRRTRAFDRIGINHVSGTPTTATIRFGFVNSLDLDGVPATLLGGAEIGSSTSMLTTGLGLKLLTINTTLTPDTWFPLLVVQFTGTQPVFWFGPNTFQWQVLPDGSGSGNILPFQNSVSGAIPSTLTPAFGVNSSPVFFLRPT